MQRVNQEPISYGVVIAEQRFLLEGGDKLFISSSLLEWDKKQDWTRLMFLMYHSLSGNSSFHSHVVGGKTELWFWIWQAHLWVYLWLPSTALVLIGICLGAHKKHQELICILDLISSSQLFCVCLMHECLFRLTEGSLKSCMFPSPAGKAVRDWMECYSKNRDEKSGMRDLCPHLCLERASECFVAVITFWVLLCSLIDSK